jgi:hypothetical protein
MSGTQDQGSQQQSETDPVSSFSDPTLKYQSAKSEAARGHGGGVSHYERVTVNLTSRGSEALELARGITGDSKTDTVNRALQVFAYVADVISKGGSIYVRESEDASLQELKLL